MFIGFSDTENFVFQKNLLHLPLKLNAKGFLNMFKNFIKSLVYDKSIFGSLSSVVTEAQNQILDSNGLCNCVRILSESGKCLRIVTFYNVSKLC